ncbi:MAG: hypothetical protein Q9225_001991 [Loekoesia sp. 1 TL-2023]
MKSFIISAVISLAATSIHYVNAAALPNVAADVTADLDVKRSIAEHCWEAPDGQIHCSLSKRSPQEHCWEAPDGQIHCSLDKRQPQEHCWEAPDGQIHCSLDKREPQEHCWEAPDGQIHCSFGRRDALAEPVADPKKPHHVDPNYPNCGAPICKRITFSKRDAAEHCWEAPDGQIHCSFDKREPQEHCWEAPDGQIHCSFALDVKRNAAAGALVAPPPAPVVNGTSRQCASWWVVINLAGQPDSCLAALVSAQNITFAQFRQLNPDVNSTCTNLKVGYAYCIQASNASFPSYASVANGTSASTTVSSSSPPLLPAVRVTEARTGSIGHGLPAPTPVSQAKHEPGLSGIVPNATTISPSSPSFAATTGLSSADCKPVTYTVVQPDHIYGIDSAGHTCQTHILPNGTVYDQPVTQIDTFTVSGTVFTRTAYLNIATDSADQTALGPSTTQAEAAHVSSQAASAAYSGFSFSSPTTSADIAVESAARGANAVEPTFSAGNVQPSSLSRHGPTVTE